MLVDTHCHLQLLDYSKLGLDMDAVVQQAVECKVLTLLCVATHLDQTPELYAISEKYVNVKISIGLHPTEDITNEPDVAAYIAAASHPQVVAIGETGLDYYRAAEQMDLQQQRFRAQIATARELGKPLIIHTRNAKQDTLDILRAERAEEVGGVLHCFTEDLDMAMRAIELGFYISFSGIVTFKNAKELQEVARSIPLERILIETDSPFLAPQPVRGHINLPANVRYVAEFIAQLRNLDFAEVAQQTTQNYLRLFARNS